ncbi:hypothetical protein BDV93DRAFT_510289 [Ceratobasidium sp. AG-I]|nr:hypothetical protein BDV93DRAFT_510289 [Ceratobasidium sp. AG-I]
MASHTPGGSTEELRHRITNIKLEPSTSTYDLSLKILIDKQEPLRLPAIPRGTPLSWDILPSRKVNLNSRVEIRVYEKRLLREPRVGTLICAVSDIVGQPGARLNVDTKRFDAILTIPPPETAKEALVTDLKEAREMKQQTRPLERLGHTRTVLKAILDAGEIVSELHPVAKIVVGFCEKAWQVLEDQEQCDANVEKLIVELADMLSGSKATSAAEHTGSDEEAN